MLDAIVDYLPSPLDVPPVTGIDPRTGEEVVRTVQPGEPFSALVFKIAADPHVGKLAFVRVYSGKLEAGSYALNSTKGERERIGRLLQMHANHREDISSVSAGDIAAVIGLKTTFTGDTLCDPAAPVVLESITFPEPVISVSIEPKTRADQDKMGAALGRLAEEDPTFRLRTNEETGQTVIEGMGELHLEVIVDRLMREFRVDANVGRPQVAYKETITVPVKAEGRHIRQSGGKGQYGHVVVEFEPQERGTGYEFEDKHRGWRHPAGVHLLGRCRHPRGAVDRRRGGLPARRSQGHDWSMARTTRSTRPRWHSRSPDRWRSRRRVRRGRTAFSSRSWRSK